MCARPSRRAGTTRLATCGIGAVTARRTVAFTDMDLGPEVMCRDCGISPCFFVARRLGPTFSTGHT